MRVADKHNLAPTRYLMLPWPEWGETDFLLTQGFDAWQQMRCPHGGHYRDECEDPLREWQVITTVCRASAAEEQFKSEAGDQLEAGTLISSYPLNRGEVPMGAEALVYDPARAAAEYEEHMARMAALT